MDWNGNRTPILGLRYSTEALLNQNWDTLDHTISNAFQPDSPIQFPESFLVPEASVTKGAIYPGDSIYAYSESVGAREGICLLANPYEAFSMTPMSAMGGRGGYYLAFGNVALSLQNTTASHVAVDLSVTVYAYGVGNSILTRLPMAIPPSPAKLPLVIPLGCRGGAPRPPDTGIWDVGVQVMKTAGADANVVMRVEAGYFAVVEMP